MTDILDLPGWEVIDSRQDDGEYIITAKHTAQPEACMKCGVIGRLYRHGTRTIRHLDSPIRGLPVRLDAVVQRYRCRDCGETFLQSLAGIDEGRRMTSRCSEYILTQGMRTTFTRVAEHVGCDEKTVRNVTSEIVTQINQSHTPYMPSILGIDETMLCKRMRCVLTDLTNNVPVDLLESRDPKTLAHWLYINKAQDFVKVVSTDMYAPYRKLVRDLLPGVPVVADKFHVVRMADLAVEHVRRRVAKTKPVEVGRQWKRQSVLLRLRRKDLDEKGRFNLDMWLDNEPDLAVAYNLKERFYDIYDAQDRKTAAELLDAWRDSIPDHVATTPRKDFRAMLTATKNWRGEILAYFDNRITNSYTEALNGITKVANRQGRGYSFEVIRAKMLYPLKGHPRMRDMPKHLDIRPIGVIVLPNNAVGSQAVEAAKALKAAYAAMEGTCPSCLGSFELEEMTLRDSTLLCKMCADRAI